MQAKHHLISLLKICFLILHFMAILNCLFLMIVLTDVHQYCVITQRNCQPEVTQSLLQPYWVQKASNLWLQDFEHYLAFPLFHKHFWACKSRGPPTCSAFSDTLPSSFAIPLNRAELWWGVGCQCALMPCIWLGKERKVSASHLGAEWKKKCYPRTGVNPYYYKTGIFKLFSGNKEPSLLSSHQKGIHTYMIKVHFIWERWRAKSVLLGFEHVDQGSLGI